MTSNIKCVFCKQSNFIKEGYRKTQNRGRIHKYRCLACGKYFTNDEGFYRMRNSDDKITSGIDLYFSALSSRKVRNYFRRHLDHNASHVSILDWCRRYTLKVQKYTNNLAPNLAGQFYADEMLVDRQNEKDAFWCSIDWDTRFITGFHYSTHREVSDAIDFIKNATKKKIPEYIQTDAGTFYPMAMRKLYYSNRLHNLKVEHRIINTSKTGKHNVRIETVFMKMRDRVNNFRGFKALWSAPILMAGIVLQHNFIEEHAALRDYPCERAGLNLNVGQDRWLDLIKLSAQ